MPPPIHSMHIVPGAVVRLDDDRPYRTFMADLFREARPNAAYRRVRRGALITVLEAPRQYRSFGGTCSMVYVSVCWPRGRVPAGRHAIAADFFPQRLGYMRTITVTGPCEIVTFAHVAERRLAGGVQLLDPGDADFAGMLGVEDMVPGPADSGRANPILELGILGSRLGARDGYGPNSPAVAAAAQGILEAEDQRILAEMTAETPPPSRARPLGPSGLRYSMAIVRCRRSLEATVAFCEGVEGRGEYTLDDGNAISQRLQSALDSLLTFPADGDADVRPTPPTKKSKAVPRFEQTVKYARRGFSAAMRFCDDTIKYGKYPVQDIDELIHRATEVLTQLQAEKAEIVRGKKALTTRFDREVPLDA